MNEIERERRMKTIREGGKRVGNRIVQQFEMPLSWSLDNESHRKKKYNEPRTA